MAEGVPNRVAIAMQFVSMLRQTRSTTACCKIKTVDMTPAERLAYDAAMDLMESYFMGRCVEQRSGKPGGDAPGTPAELSPKPGDGGGASVSGGHFAPASQVVS